VVEPGRRCLGDRYELRKLIAAGGMGQVWQGFDEALHRPVAVKVLRSEYTGDPTFVARFRAEAQNAASLSHPNIAAVFDYGEELAQDGTGETLAYLVMELVDGEPLSTLLAREGALDTTTTLSLLRQTAFALADAHRAGMVHRDVKPGNILVRPDGGVKITDFGIASSARSVALTRTGQVIGTPQYLSPEQAEGRLATPASDVYALGLIGYECLTGHPAFEGDNAVTIALKQVRQDPEPLPGKLPPGVRTLITRALVKDPGARIPDGAAFVQAIEDVIAGRELPEPPRTVSAARVIPRAAQEGRHSTHDTGPVVRPPVRRRRRAGLAMVLLPLLGLLAGAGIAAAVLTAVTSGSPDTAAAAQQRQSGSIVFDAKDFLGRPVDQVTQQLSALGLNVELRADPGADVAPGMVTDVQPTAGLAPGDTVVVRYAARAPDTGRGMSPVTGAAVGNRATVDREPSARVAVTPAAPTSTDTTGSDTLTGSLPDTSTTNESSGTRSTSPSTDTDTSSTSRSTSRSTSEPTSEPKSSSSTSTVSSETTTSSKSHDD
jgi:eukaryotic-like serine/threonine-protein kinase